MGPLALSGPMINNAISGSMCIMLLSATGYAA